MRSQNTRGSFIAILVTIGGVYGCNAASHSAATGPITSINPSACTTDLEDDACGGGSGDGFGLSGRTLNGTTLDGDNLTGHGLVGVSFFGASTASGSWDLVYLQGSELSSLRGSILGTIVQGEVDTGRLLPIRIEGVTAGVGEDETDIMLYTATYQTTSGWLPLCGTDSTGAAVPAVAFSGRWNYQSGVPGGGSHIDDPTSFTLGCDGYALAKCAELGYKPWDSIAVCNQWGCSNVSLAPTHQACTRAVRADYCGDGVSYTLDGTLIDIYDSFDVRTASPGWPFEAEWTAAGARCAVRERQPSLGTPTCWSSLQSATCGQAKDFNSGTLIMTQDSPPASP